MYICSVLTTHTSSGVIPAPEPLMSTHVVIVIGPYLLDSLARPERPARCAQEQAKGVPR